MSYTAFPSNTAAAAPGATDDNTKGYVVGSQWIDTSVAPRRAYVCTNASTGAATWINAGGVTAHTGLTALAWAGSGHTGNTNSLACFDSATGAAQVVQAASEGSVLGLSGGVLTFIAIAAAAAVTNNSAKTIDILYLAPTEVLNSTPISAGTAGGSFV